MLNQMSKPSLTNHVHSSSFFSSLWRDEWSKECLFALILENCFIRDLGDCPPLSNKLAASLYWDKKHLIGYQSLMNRGTIQDYSVISWHFFWQTDEISPRGGKVGNSFINLNPGPFEPSVQDQSKGAFKLVRRSAYLSEIVIAQSFILTPRLQKLFQQTRNGTWRGTTLRRCRVDSHLNTEKLFVVENWRGNWLPILYLSISPLYYTQLLHWL